MDQNQEKFDALLTHLAQTLGLGEVDKASENVCSFGSENMYVTLIHQHDTLIYMTNVGNIPMGSAAAQIKDILLSANVLYRGTRGGTLGVEETGIISYCYQCSLAELTNESFLVILENYMSVAKKWTEHIASIIKGELSSNESSTTLDHSETWVKI